MNDFDETGYDPAHEMKRPYCDVCGAHGNGVVYPMLPKHKGYKFGTICVPCDNKEDC